MARRSEDGNNHEIREAVGIVRLMNAALCVDCEHISEARGEKCPRCGSPSLLNLARILNRDCGDVREASRGFRRLSRETRESAGE